MTWGKKEYGIYSHFVSWKRARLCGPTTSLCASKGLDGLLTLCAISVDIVSSTNLCTKFDKGGTLFECSKKACLVCRKRLKR